MEQVQGAKPRKKKKWIVLGVIAVVLLLIVWRVASCSKQMTNTLRDASIRSATASLGSVATSVSGSGTLTAAEADDVAVPYGVEVDTVYVEAGELVSQGDVLASVDTLSVQTAMADVASQLSTLSAQIESAKNDTSGAYIAAGVSGRVKVIYAAKGDSVQEVMQQHGALALLSLDGKMAVSLPRDGQVTLGESVTVTRADGATVKGAVAEFSGETMVVTLTDNGPLYGESVTVAAADGRALGSGTLTIHRQVAVTGFEGTVLSVSARENAQVYSASTLFTLTELGHTAAYEKLVRQHQELSEKLQRLSALAQNPVVTAPFDGTIRTVPEEESTSTTTTSSAASSASSYLSGYYPTAGVSTATPSVTLLSNVVLLGREEGEGAPALGATPTPSATFSLQVQIEVSGRNIADYDGAFTLVLSHNDTELLRGSNDAAGVVSFTAFPLTTPGSYTCQLTQSYAGSENITCESGKTVTVTVDAGGATAVADPAAITLTNTVAAATPSPSPSASPNPSTGTLPSISVGGYSSGSYSGDTSSSTTTATQEDTVLFTLSPNDEVTVSVNVDELDILAIQKGQTAQVTIDALDGEEVTGTVTAINTIGSSSGGVSKYKVTVSIEKTEKMLINMNASVTITIDQADNCLLIPENALNQKGNSTFVYTTYDEESGALGGETEVTTGVSDGTSVQIISGLTEGDTVYYQYTASSMSDMMFMMSGGVGGASSGDARPMERGERMPE